MISSRRALAVCLLHSLSSPALAQTSSTEAAVPANTGIGAADASQAQSPSSAATTAPTDNGIGEIVVTATRRAENLQQVPISVSAISSAQLASRGVALTNDLATVAPNVTVNTQYGETQPNFTIRGVGVANEFNVNAASPVGVYVDDVYKSFRFTHGQSLFDLDRVEVLRGPQGTLFGRNTTGGAINLITRKPTLSGSSGYVTAGYGNYDRYKVEGALETTLKDDEAGIRVAGYRTKQDGFFREVDPSANKFGSKRYNGVDSYGGRVTLRIKPSDRFDVTLSGQYGHDNPTGPARYAYGIVPNGSGGFTDFSGYSRFDDPLIKSKNQFHMNDMGKFKTISRSGILNMTWNDGDHFSVTSVTGYTSGLYDLNDESDGGPNGLVGIHYRASTRDFSQDVRINYDSDNFKFILGGYYGTDRLRARNDLGFFGFLPDATSPGTFNPGVSSSFNALQVYGQDRKSKAVYGEGNYKFSSKLDLTIGLRYTDDQIEYVNGKSTVYSNFSSTGTPLFPLFSNLNQKNGSKKVSGRAILNYNFADDIHAYVSFSRGQRSGTYNGFAYQSASQVYFVPPEQLDAYEGGLKTRFFDNRLQVNAAVFHYDYKGQQVQEIRGVVGFLTSVDAKVDGAELEVIARPIPDLTLRGNVGYLDTRYAGGSVISGVDIGGNKLPFAPKITANGGFDFTLAKMSAGNIVVSGDAQYTGLFWYDIFNDDQPPPPGFTRQIVLRQKAYTLLNARLSLVNSAFTLALWGKNLTNKTYYPAGYNVEGGVGIDYQVRGAPRTYGVEGTIRF
ncbi:TonB-dependent receptor [Sphingomonas sp. ID0503]|uniref:TonB-dependent receptor n=1 Tax=Sphingomonas sp. ID0503 TaxID=3399691 RepID=UPI003AFA0900